MSMRGKKCEQPYAKDAKDAKDAKVARKARKARKKTLKFLACIFRDLREVFAPFAYGGPPSYSNL